MRVVLTGATGFVGSHLAEEFVANAHEVICITRESSSMKYLEGLPVERRIAPLENREALVEEGRL